MRLAVGSDHAGFEDPEPHYKPEIVRHVKALGHEVVDCGPEGSEAVDYPDYADKVCEAIISGDADAGILLCGTGIGMGMKANRHQGIRAAVCANTEMAELSREHNDANVLCVGCRILSLDDVIDIIDTWLDTPFNKQDRHVRRVKKIG